MVARSRIGTRLSREIAQSCAEIERAQEVIHSKEKEIQDKNSRIADLQAGLSQAEASILKISEERSAAKAKLEQMDQVKEALEEKAVEVKHLTATIMELKEKRSELETIIEKEQLATEEKLQLLDGIDPGDIIMSPEKAKIRGLTSTMTFLQGNLAPEGALVKSTAISPSRIDDDGVFRHEGPARVMANESEAIEAIKSGIIQPGDTMVLIGLGPGCGMPETFQITTALKHIKGGESIALLTDGRFSGWTKGYLAIGNVCPEAQVGGPLALVRDGDKIDIDVPNRKLDVDISEEEIAQRRSEWTPPDQSHVKGTLLMYAMTALQADKGAGWPVRWSDKDM